MSGLKMFECLGDCADFDLVNGCVAGDQAEAVRASQQAQGQGRQQQQQQQQQRGAEDGEYSEGDGSEDGSQRSYSDVSITDLEEETKSTGGGGVCEFVVWRRRVVAAWAYVARQPAVSEKTCEKTRELFYVGSKGSSFRNCSSDPDRPVM